MRKILFASSEVHPLIKTGGLADVSGSLPLALHKHGQDIRIIIPAYRQCLEALEDINCVATIKLDGVYEPVEILQSTLPNSDVPLWLVHSPQHYDRQGGPYCKEEGGDWDDNAARFALFSRAIAALALNQAGLNWQPEVLHCNDWQTGLAVAFVSEYANRPKTVFTIHNLAYQGLYSKDVFDVFVCIVSCKYWLTTRSTISLWSWCCIGNFYYFSATFEKEVYGKNERFWWFWFWTWRGRILRSGSKHWCKICMPYL